MNFVNGCVNFVLKAHETIYSVYYVLMKQIIWDVILKDKVAVFKTQHIVQCYEKNRNISSLKTFKTEA